MNEKRSTCSALWHHLKKKKESANNDTINILSKISPRITTPKTLVMIAIIMVIIIIIIMHACQRGLSAHVTGNKEKLLICQPPLYKKGIISQGSERATGLRRQDFSVCSWSCFLFSLGDPPLSQAGIAFVLTNSPVISWRIF